LNAKLKPMPSLASDDAADVFVSGADLTEYDLSQFKPMKYEIAKKEAFLNMHLPVFLLDSLRAKAKSKGIPHSRYIRMLIEADLQSPG